MRIALLGIDDTVLELTKAALHNGEEIALIDALAKRATEAAAIAPRARLEANWEAALDMAAIDAVFVAADQPAARLEQLRRLIQAGMPVLVSHPVSMSMLECYELEMIRGETGNFLQAYLPGRWHPAMEELATLVDDGESGALGKIEQLVMERFLAQRDRTTVLTQFLRDADVLQFLGGDATKLHALGGSASSLTNEAFAKKDIAPDRYANLAVQLACERGVVCRWNVAPIESESSARITIIGSFGKAILSIPSADAPWKFELRGTHDSFLKEFPDWNAPTLALRKLSAATATTNSTERAEADPSWSEAARCVELTETIDSSLSRGRTIDLHREQFSDIGTFKGTMTSIGCGLLLVAMLAAGLVAVVHAVAVHAGWNQLAGWLDLWPFLLLGACGLYLILQLFVFVGSPKTPGDSASASGEWQSSDSDVA